MGLVPLGVGSGLMIHKEEMNNIIFELQEQIKNYIPKEIEIEKLVNLIDNKSNNTCKQL